MALLCGPFVAHRGCVNMPPRALREAFIAWSRNPGFRPAEHGRTSCTLARRFRPDVNISRAQRPGEGTHGDVDGGAGVN